MLPIQVVTCPYCGESIDLIIDNTVDRQSYVEDCSVCCRPIEVEVALDELSGVQVICKAEGET